MTTEHKPHSDCLASLEVRILGDLDDMNLGQEDRITDAFREAVELIKVFLEDFPMLVVETNET